MSKVKKKIEALLKRVRKLNEKIKKLRTAGAKKAKKKKLAKSSAKKKAGSKKKVGKTKKRSFKPSSRGNGSNVSPIGANQTAPTADAIRSS